jgi:P-type Ca2+ transporter type 2C
MPGADRQGTLAGLTSAEAALRLRQWGPNVLAPPGRFANVRQIAAWLGSPLILILLVASAISAALGQHAGSVVIALMVVLGAALNATQRIARRPPPSGSAIASRSAPPWCATAWSATSRRG